ncbi:MaoC/PaaZ C-terminal domain-containing protein [Brevibacterium litoralis]|uniref:MaoC/PaaZ C-terminal domain-containing protein n=1 Tax=Brevibacterium litoralis TaxID=3138935 RepID=UPI0032ECE521
MSDERLKAEDLPIGEEIDLGTFHVTEDAIIEFAQQWDPQYFHIDRDAAASSDFGGIIASGIHSVAIFQRLCVEGFYGRYDIIAGRKVTDLRFHRPVFPDTTLRGAVTIEAVEAAGPGRAAITSTGTLYDERGRPMFSLVNDALIRTREEEYRAG